MGSVPRTGPRLWVMGFDWVRVSVCSTRPGVGDTRGSDEEEACMGRYLNEGCVHGEISQWRGGGVGSCPLRSIQK